MNGRTPNEIAISNSDAVMVERAPIRSAIAPMGAMKKLTSRAAVRPPAISALLQPNSCSSGSTNNPKLRMIPPTTKVFARNTTPATT